jgi:opacity protein-like surface antigen
MPVRLDSRDPGFAESFDTLLGSKREVSEEVGATVAGILDDVRTRGDDALLEYTTRFEAGGDVYEVSASVLSPAIGIKYFAIQNAKIKGYFGLSLSKPFLTGKLVEDGDEDPDFKEAIDKVSTFGFELGFGAEYFFVQNFSIGGEYGFRNLSIKYSESDSEYEVKGRISPTYTKFTLNYYFGGTEE